MLSLRLRCLSHCAIALALALVVCGSASCADAAAQSPSSVDVPSRTVGLLFVPDNNQWLLACFSQAKSGDEFYFGGRLYRATGPGKAQVVLIISASRLAEADLPYDRTSRHPIPGDVVQNLGSDMQFVEHAEVSSAKSGSVVRFQGKVYKIGADRKLVDTGITLSADATPLRRIEITRSGLQHVLDRHSVGGSSTAGTSIFCGGENIQALIMDAQIATPVLEQNGYYKRVMDAGRIIGGEGLRGKRTSAYRVITTQSGKLVTAYPVAD